MFDKKLLLQHITNLHLNEETTDLTQPTQEQIDAWHTLSPRGKKRIRSGNPDIDWDYAEANPPTTTPPATTPPADSNPATTTPPADSNPARTTPPTTTPPATTPPATTPATVPNPTADERLGLPDPDEIRAKADEIRAKAIARIQDEIGDLDNVKRLTGQAKEVFTPILKKAIETARTTSEGLPQLAAFKKEMQAWKPNIPASPRRNIGDAPKYKKRVNTKGF